MKTPNTPDQVTRDNRKNWPKFILVMLLCTAGGAVHIGDSARSDVEGARAAGIEAVLLCRGGQPAPCGVRAAQTLPEALALALA